MFKRPYRFVPPSRVVGAVREPPARLAPRCRGEGGGAVGGGREGRVPGPGCPQRASTPARRRTAAGPRPAWPYADAPHPLPPVTHPTPGASRSAPTGSPPSRVVGAVREPPARLAPRCRGEGGGAVGGGREGGVPGPGCPQRASTPARRRTAGGPRPAWPYADAPHPLPPATHPTRALPEAPLQVHPPSRVVGAVREPPARLAPRCRGEGGGAVGGGREGGVPGPGCPQRASTPARRRTAAGPRPAWPYADAPHPLPPATHPTRALPEAPLQVHPPSRVVGAVREPPARLAPRCRGEGGGAVGGGREGGVPGPGCPQRASTPARRRTAAGPRPAWHYADAPHPLPPATHPTPGASRSAPTGSPSTPPSIASR